MNCENPKYSLLCNGDTRCNWSAVNRSRESRLTAVEFVGPVSTCIMSITDVRRVNTAISVGASHHVRPVARYTHTTYIHTHQTDVVASDAASIFTARPYAGEVFAFVVCPSVRPCVRRRYCIETSGRIELIFFATASRSGCQQTRRRRRRSSLLTTPIYDNRRVVALYYMSVSCNSLTPLVQLVVDL